MIYIEIADIYDNNKVVFSGDLEEASLFLDISSNSILLAFHKKRIIRNRYLIDRYVKYDKEIEDAILSRLFIDYINGSTLNELEETYYCSKFYILNQLKKIAYFEEEYSHCFIDDGLKEVMKLELAEGIEIEKLCRNYRITKKQIESILKEENEKQSFQKISKENILKRAFHQSKKPNSVYNRIKNTSRFTLWNEDEDALKIDIYEYFRNEIDGYL